MTATHTAARQIAKQALDQAVADLRSGAKTLADFPYADQHEDPFVYVDGDQLVATCSYANEALYVDPETGINSYEAVEDAEDVSADLVKLGLAEPRFHVYTSNSLAMQRTSANTSPWSVDPMTRDELIRDIVDELDGADLDWNGDEVTATITNPVTGDREQTIFVMDPA